MVAKKNALGRGLGALIESDEDRDLLQERISSGTEIAIANITANPYQPRSKFDEEALEELAASIRELGVIQPVTVREAGPGNYQLITGERRFRASKLAGLDRIPAFIRSADDNNLLELALVENIQREDLDAIEIAISYQRLLDECNLTQEALSQRVGKKRATVANYLRLLNLPAEIQLAIRDKQLSMGHAKVILALESDKHQLEVYHQVVSQELSVRKTEELIREMMEKVVEPGSGITGGAKPTSSSGTGILPKEYEDLRLHLCEFFNANIDFRRADNGKGRISIPFKSDEELERIIAIFDALKR